eukprot:13023_1
MLEQCTHTAFRPAAVVVKAKHRINCVATWHDRFIVATANCQIRIYTRHHTWRAGRTRNSATDQSAPPNYKETDIIDTAKREITQMTAIDHQDVLVCIADTYIRVHSLPDFRLVTQLHKTKGCHLFAMNRRESGAGGLYLCVALKKRLLLYVWKGCEIGFVEQKEFVTPEKVRTLVFAGRNICVGMRNDYSLIRVGSGEISGLFAVGRNKCPVVVSLPGRELMLCQDTRGICVSFDGKPTRKRPMQWSEPPLRVGFHAPFIIGVMQNHVEVRNLDTGALSQKTSLKHGQQICTTGDILVSSNSDVIAFLLVPVVTQLSE